jgi:hypothetical protein
MAGNAVLIQYGPDIPAELHMIGGLLVEDRTNEWPD